MRSDEIDKMPQLSKKQLKQTKLFKRKRWILKQLKRLRII